MACVLFGGTSLSPCTGGDGLGSVTSDCRPWGHPARAVACLSCGHLQKADPAASLDGVYADYELYRLSDGGEHLVFGEAGDGTARSELLLDRIAGLLPAEGRFLDVGCGNGATLRAFAGRRGGWKLFGFEPGASCRNAVLGIPGVEGFWSGTLDAVEPPFDLVGLVHVLEHVPAPRRLLERLRSLMSPGGTLLLQVPNVLENPFDLVVIDHVSHFTPELLRGLAASAGFEVVALATDWVPKEISCVLQGGGSGRRERAPSDGSAEQLRSSAAWLRSVLEDARGRAGGAGLGVFGTALAGTWLGSALGAGLRFFVDEDARRIGKRHLGKPVLGPGQVGPDDAVYLAFPHAVARSIHSRLSGRAPGRYIVPPETMARAR